MDFRVLGISTIIAIGMVIFIVCIINILSERGKKMKTFLALKVILELIALVLTMYSAAMRISPFGELEAAVFILTILDLIESLSNLIE